MIPLPIGSGAGAGCPRWGLWISPAALLCIFRPGWQPSLWLRMLGIRKGYPSEMFIPHNLTMTLLGPACCGSGGSASTRQRQRRQCQCRAGLHHNDDRGRGRGLCLDDHGMVAGEKTQCPGFSDRHDSGSCHDHARRRICGAGLGPRHRSVRRSHLLLRSEAQIHLWLR